MLHRDNIDPSLSFDDSSLFEIEKPLKELTVVCVSVVIIKQGARMFLICTLLQIQQNASLIPVEDFNIKQVIRHYRPEVHRFSQNCDTAVTSEWE